VERQWAFSEQLAGDGRALQASLVFRVLPSGEVTDIRFTERSDNSYLDESAYKAIVKASPVSPHPAGVRALYVTVALRFTPQGIR
jgi:colicin import membrane protein